MNPKDFLPVEFAFVQDFLNPSIKKYPENYSGYFISIIEIIKTHVFDINDVISLQKAIIFLYKRQNLLCSYYVDEPNGNYTRKYIDPEKSLIPLEVVQMNYEFESSLMTEYMKSKMNPSRLYDQSSNMRIYFCKTLNRVILYNYGNHCAIDAHGQIILAKEFFDIYLKIKADPNISYENAIKDLPKLLPYSEVIKNYWKRADVIFDDLCVYLKSKFEKLDLSNEPLWKKSTITFETNKLNFSFSKESIFCKIINNLGLKCFHVIQLLFQIALIKIFKIKSKTFPIWKLNGSRPENAKYNICCHLKEQIFIEPIDQNRTFYEQFKNNAYHRKEMLSKFNDIDFIDALTRIEKEMNTDCFPTILFNSYETPFANKIVHFKHVSGEFYMLDKYYNLSYDILDCEYEKKYNNYIMYRTKIFEDKKIQLMIDFMKFGIDHFEFILNEKISNLVQNDLFFVGMSQPKL